MPYPIEEKLVIAVASSALFDLSESYQVYRDKGVEEYRAYQRQHDNDVLKPGIAFPLIKRLLALNGVTESDHPVDVILLSRNDPDTGLRVFRSIEHHKLDITRAAFVSGRDPCRYLGSFNACLFLSANAEDVQGAIASGAPAGQVFPTEFVDKESDRELRIAFDFDGVIADDSAEAVNKSAGLEGFLESERSNAAVPLPIGPLHRFFTEVAKLQQSELALRKTNPSYELRYGLQSLRRGTRQRTSASSRACESGAYRSTRCSFLAVSARQEYYRSSGHTSSSMTRSATSRDPPASYHRRMCPLE